jgi:hypothetical protein
MSDLKHGSPTWWNKEVEDRTRALRKNWLDAADKLVAQYEAEDRDTNTAVFNILFSNTETLLPALYNSTPRPDVARRYTSRTAQRELDSAVGQAAERLLEYSEDSNTNDYGCFDNEIREAVLHALVPGQGQTRVRVVEEEGHQQLVYDTLAYDRFIWQYARKWCQVSWVGFGYDLNQAGFESQFPEFCRTEVYRKWAIGGWKALKEKFDSDPNSKPRDDKTGQRREPSLLVWEIWDYPGQRLVWICDNFKDEFVRHERYPFKLSSRFPCPTPLSFIKRNNNLDPKPPYALYEAQDRELQEVSRRFLRVVKAIRARGAYNSKLTELEKIFGEDSDNALIAVENADFLMQDGKGFDNAIWMVPIDMLVQVATQLAEARENIKQTIYEITGIGDLLRGQAESTQTAQQASTQSAWGTLRVKRMQGDVSIFCRELFRIGYEFMVNTYSQATIADITKLEYLTKEQKLSYQKTMAQFQQQQQHLQQAFQEAMAQHAQIAQQAQASGQPVPPAPQPPPQQPPPLPPDQLRLMSFPTWEEILEVMRNKFERTYRVDIETNSTVDLEATEDKAAMSEFMNAFGQMAAGLENMSQTGILPYDVSKEIVGEMLRRFRFGRRVEQLLEMAQPPQGNAQAQAQQAEMLKQQHAAEVAAKDSQIQGVRAQLREAQAEFAKEKVELVSALTKEKIELTTARGQAQIDGKIAEHASALKDVTHATEKGAMRHEIAGAQRQTEMERMNHLGTKNTHQQELFSRDQQLAGFKNDADREKFAHEQESNRRDLDMHEQELEHNHEKRKLETGLQQTELKHATERSKEAKKAADSPAGHTEALKGLIEHTKGLAESMQKLHEAVHSPRETVIEIGPDGKKRGISRVAH